MKAAVISVIVVLAMVQLMVKPGQAINCGQVDASLAPCLTYLRQGGNPPPQCCDGVRTITGMATTPQTKGRHVSVLRMLPVTKQLSTMIQLKRFPKSVELKWIFPSPQPQIAMPSTKVEVADRKWNKEVGPLFTGCPMVSVTIGGGGFLSVVPVLRWCGGC
ncbi:hypothetical protein RJ639_020078 [Escallonia herrerae]|uniref:Bifunctional inhibitor/plant lipid transfer protein/seed storage helical domain-containing protein n=1 Tax=Escallonia herrerae TaxID=1293975 RepID=A0AA88V9F9_9ASTE|nr:hypothetical protein RJ639_020078 [Escallonia herrerae]